MNLPVRKRYRLKLRSRDWLLGERTLVMGVLNVTPDSFSDGGKFLNRSAAVQQAQKLIASGADIIDIGGESARPFSDPVPLDEELDRVIPVVKEIREFSDVIISVDTTKAEVAHRAIEAGADIINDVSALRFDPDMASVVSESGVPIVLMHMLGTPKTMQKDPSYQSLFSEIIGFLEQRIQHATGHGIARSQIIVDPGIGFGKTVSHNLDIIRNLDLFSSLDRPLLIGASRKSFIGSILNRSSQEREPGTAAVNAIAIANGAHIVRVHDVGFHKDVIRMVDAIREGL